jgi:hypothetical protein
MKKMCGNIHVVAGETFQSLELSPADFSNPWNFTMMRRFPDFVFRICFGFRASGFEFVSEG